MIFVRQQGEVLPSDFLISRQGAVGRDQPLNANSAAAVAGFLCLGISLPMILVLLAAPDTNRVSPAALQCCTV
jgi:hypothetical protein